MHAEPTYQLEPREICSLCSILKPSIAVVLARIEETGWILRSRMPTHQRRVLLTLAPEGDRLLIAWRALIELPYQSIAQAVRGQLVTELVSALVPFIAADSAAVAHLDFSGISPATNYRWDSATLK